LASAYTTKILNIIKTLNDFQAELTSSANEVYKDANYLAYAKWGLIEIDGGYQTQPPYYETFRNPTGSPYDELAQRTYGLIQDAQQGLIPEYGLDPWIAYIQKGIADFRVEHQKCKQWLAQFPPMPPSFVPAATGNVYAFGFIIPPLPEYVAVAQDNQPASTTSLGICMWEAPSDHFAGLIQEPSLAALITAHLQPLTGIVLPVSGHHII